MPISDCEVSNLPLCSRVLMAPRYVFPIKDIENSMLEIHEPLPASWLADVRGDTDAEANPDQQGQLDGSLTMSGQDVVVCGSVKASVYLECARCLQKTSVPVEGELALLLIPGKAPPSEGDENASGQKAKGRKGRGRKKKGDDDGHLISLEDAEMDTYVGDEVVLDGFVREAILLELPIFPLCSETCPGIGTVPSETAETASAEEAIDPRLAPLLEFKKKSRV